MAGLCPAPRDPGTASGSQDDGLNLNKRWTDYLPTPSVRALGRMFIKAELCLA